MPIIPLLRPPGPLANAPAPVLDNLRRPTVDRSAETQALGDLGRSFKRPMVDPEAFTQPLEAMGAVGRAVVQGGGVLSALAIKKQEAETDIQVAKADTVMQDAFAKHAAWRESNPDPSGWERHLTDTLTKARGTIGADGKLHPEAKRLIALRTQKFIGDAHAGVVQDTAKQTFKMAASSAQASWTLSIANKRYDEGIATARQAMEKGYIFPHQFAAVEAGVIRSKELDRQEAEQNERLAKAKLESSELENVLAAAMGDPDRAEAMVKAEGFAARTSPTVRSRAMEIVRDQRRNQFADAQSVIMDGIAAGTIRTDSDIDAIAPKTLRPAERQFLKDKLAKEYSDAAKLEAARPENVRERFGALLDAVKQFDARELGGTDSKAARDAYSGITLEAGLLPEVLRNDIIGPLEKKWRGTAELDTTIRGYIRESLDDLYENNGFGATTMDVNERQPDGFLKWVKKTDVEGQRKARALYADAMIALNQWAKENPNATREDATAAIYALSGQSMRVDEAAKILSGANAATSPGIPGASSPDAGLFPSIANSLSSGFTGGKITSYGYSDDETPDSNSSAGIGAWAPPAEQEKIKRGEASDFKLKPGDLAVSPDVEAAFQRANIRPGDTVTLTYADGTTHTGRWMDRTAREYKGKALKGRFDLYSPTGKHARDGQPVISFTRS